MARAIENARLYRRLAEREEMLERFATRTVEAQELERRRLAGEIHDGISQRLVSLWYHLLAAEDAAAATPTRLRRELAVAKELATAALDEARGGHHRPAPLRPRRPRAGPGPGEPGPVAAGVEVRSTSSRSTLPRPRRGRPVPHRPGGAAERGQARRGHRGSLRLHRATTASAWSSPTTARASTRTPAGGEDRHSYGLVGIRERAELIGARSRSTSRPGRGTTVEVVLPLPSPPDSRPETDAPRHQAVSRRGGGG